MSVNLDKAIEQFAAQPVIEIKTPELRPIRPPYKPGELVKVRVTKIVEYGAFVITLDGYEYPGLIHIKSIADAYIEHVRDYFDEGDELEAQVKKVSKDCKIEFSTWHLGLEPKRETGRDKQMERELEQIRVKLESIVGVLSPESEERLQRMIRDQGVFNFGFYLCKALETFKPDLSHYLLNEIEKVSEGL